MSHALIFDHVRTPRGKGRPDGRLHEIAPVQLAAQVLKALKERNGLAADGVEEVILGVVTGYGEQGPTLSRIAPLLAGFADQVPGLQVNRFCASGLEAVALGAAKIIAGACDVVIGGGVESMSRVTMGSDGGGPWGTDPRVTGEIPFSLQGVSADLLATMLGLTRGDLDSYAFASQQRAFNAWEKGYFSRSVIGVRDVLGSVVLDRDEHLRPDVTVESLSKLKPVFEMLGSQFGFDGVVTQRYPTVEKVIHMHTAGTSSGIVDGAGAVLLGSREAGEYLDLKPRAKILSFYSMGSEPQLFLDAPAPTCLKALKKAGMSVCDVDLWELNEAFAVVPLQVMQTLGIPHEKMNVNGGAIAMGHPLGATGAMILGTLLDELERRNLATGVATLCAAGGQSIAMVIERV